MSRKTRPGQRRPLPTPKKAPSRKWIYVLAIVVLAIIVGAVSYWASTIGPPRNFTITASSPSNVVVGRSSSAELTITPQDKAFFGMHTFALVTDPGLNCEAISPVNINASRIVNLSCTASSGGSYTATVTDTMGSTAHTATVTFNFKDYKIQAPAGIVIHPGTSSTAQVNVTAINQYSDQIQLSAAGTPGLNATITPSSLSGAGIATLTVSASKAGNYTVTVTGESLGLTRSVTPSVATPMYAKLDTTNGVIEVELYQNLAPKTVNNFVNLARQGFYSNLVWHRIVAGFVIQTGDPNTRTGDRSTWGQGGSAQTVPLEIDPTLHNNLAYLGMARSSDPNSGSSQFYINLANNNSLDRQYTVFGKVISGMDVVTSLGNTPVNSQSQPVNPVYVNSVTILNNP